MGRLSEFINGYKGKPSFISVSVNNNAVRIQEKNLRRMMTDNPDTRKMIQDLIRETIWEARNAVAQDVRGVIGNKGQSARSVRNIVYKKLLGANINITSNKKRGEAAWKVVQVQRKVDANPKMRGGNRRKRSMRTIKIQGYEPTARGFILRWQNAGTNQRFIGGRNRYKTNIEYLNRIETGTGNRGRIKQGRFFERLASQQVGKASDKLSKLIEEEIAKIYNNNNI